MNYVLPDQVNVSARLLHFMTNLIDWQPKDEVVKDHGVQVYIDHKAVFYVVGTTMDYVDNEIAAEVNFRNFLLLS